MTIMTQSQQAAVSSAAARPTPAPRGARGDRAGIFLWLLFFVLCAVAWQLGNMELYTAESDLGYNLGLVGGILMLTLLLYPVIKRSRALHRIMPLKYWFRGHMVLGMTGPILILFHSNLRLESINGSVAFLSMLAVFLSGLIGRFIYTRIHLGLYGRRAHLDEFREKLGLRSEEAHSRFRFAPEVDERLHRFEARFSNTQTGLLFGLVRIVFFPFALWWTYWRSSREIKQIIRRHGRKRGWERSRILERIRYANSMMMLYLRSIQSVAQFHLYERLFSFWHLLHVPLIALLLVSGIIHVLAVHMY